MGKAVRRKQETKRRIEGIERTRDVKWKPEKKVRVSRQESIILLQEKVPRDERRIQRVETEKSTNSEFDKEERGTGDNHLRVQVNHGEDLQLCDHKRQR